MKPIALIILLISTLLSCKEKDHVWNEESNRVAREVRQILTQYYTDINAEGFMAEFRYLDSTAEFSWHPPGFAGPIGFDSVKSILMQNVNRDMHVHLQWDSLTIMPVNRQKANYRGLISSVKTDSTGRSDTIYLQEYGIVVKRQDGWKLLSGKTIIKS